MMLTNDRWTDLAWKLRPDRDKSVGRKHFATYVTAFILLILHKRMLRTGRYKPDDEVLRMVNDSLERRGLDRTATERTLDLFRDHYTRPQMPN